MMSIKSLILHYAGEVTANIQHFIERSSIGNLDRTPEVPPLSPEEQELHKMRRAVKSMADRIELVKDSQARLSYSIRQARENGEDTAVSERLLKEVQNEVDRMTKQIEVAQPALDDMERAVNELQRQQELTNILNILRSKD
jgi:septal ring factor EnvC (AmiA/AmiB activator)